MKLMGNDALFEKLCYLIAGARVDVLNNDGKTAYDLAREPLTASILQHVERPVVASEGYGDDDDSD